MQKMTITTVAIMVGLLLIVVLGVGLYLWYMSQQPMYQPGMVREGKNLRTDLTAPAQNPNASTWLVEQDIELHHFSQGQGRNVLIVHGGPGMPFSEPLDGLDPLTDRYQFHYYDQRGSGESTRPIDRFESDNYYQNMTSLEQSLGLGAQIADIERIRQILGDDKLILIGHSWGAFIASLYAAEFPERVEALILVSPAEVLVMPQETDGGLFEQVARSLPPEKLAEYEAYMAEYMDFSPALFKKSEADIVAMNEKFGEYYINVVGEVTDLNDSPQQGKPGGWMTFAMYFSMGQKHDYRPALQAVTAPVLVIHGQNDLQSEAASRIYADAFPNAEFQVIPNASHFAMAEQPELFAQSAASFLP